MKNTSQRDLHLERVLPDGVLARSLWRIAPAAGLMLLAGALPGCVVGDPPEDPEAPTPDPHADLDRDGFTPDQGDCDNLNSAVYPGSIEHEDGIDNDCDGAIDELTNSSDDDGDGYSEYQGDCDDADPVRHPDQPDEIDGIDIDCDGAVDEDGNWGGDPVPGTTTVRAISSATATLVRTYGESWSYMSDTRWVRDLDGDGLDELAIATVDGDAQGRVFLFYGRTGGLSGTIDVATADAVFEGVGGPNLNGTKVVGDGDLDGDGYNDLLIGDIFQQRISFFPGGASRRSGTQRAADAGATFQSVTGGSYIADVGCSIALPGDVDGDGFSDLIVGQPGYDNCRGRVLLIRGGKAFSGQVDLEEADAVLEGELAGDFAGGMVGGIGDFDQDGLADFVVNAPTADHDQENASIYLYYGATSGFSGTGTLAEAPARFSSAIHFDALQASHGDFDGDGRSDTALGFPCSKLAVVLYGGTSRLTGDLRLEEVAGTFFQSTDASAPSSYYGTEDAGFGGSIGLSSDFNQDGRADLAVAAATSYFQAHVNSSGTVTIDYEPGYLAVFPGRADRPGSLRAGYSDSVLIEGADGTLEIVWPVSTGGDFDGDGREDLLFGSDIGATSTTSSNRTFIFAGFTL